MPHCSDPVLNGQRSSSGISVLDRLIKTCPVWLQLCMAPKQAAETLSREDSGIFLVTRDVGAKCMVLWVHFSERKEQTDDILRYNIREEKTMMYLDGSMLVFDDIFKLVAFYCVSRDILPSPLRLPHVIANTRSLKDLEVISNLGTGFWDSSIKHQRSASASHSGKFSSLANVRSKDVSHGQRTAKEPSDCACEIEISVRSDRLWFVNPIFIEECSNIQTSDKLPLTNCAKPELQLPKTVYRRPPPPPPPPSLHKPPLPSLPPSAPPPNYKPPHSHSTPSGSSTSSSVVSSSPSISEASSHCPAPGSPPTESLIQSPPAIPPSSQSLSLCSPPRSPKSEHLTLHSPEKPFTTDPPYLLSSTDPSPNCSQSGPPSLHSLSDPFSLHSPPNCSPTDPSSLCSPTDPSSLRSPTDPSSLRSPTDPSSLRSPTNPSSLRSPTNPSSLRSPTNPSSLRSPTDPSSLRSPPNSSQSDPHSLHSPTTSPSTEPLAVRSSASSSPTESSPSSPRPSSPPPSCSIPPLSQTDVPLLPSASQALKKAENFAETSTVISVDVDLVGQPLKNMKINNVEEKKDHVGNDLHPQGSQNLTPTRLPPAVPKRRLSGKHSETKTNISAMKMDLQGKPGQASPDLKTRMKLEPKLPKQTETCVSVKTTLENKVISPGQQSATEEHGKKTPPMPPPRKKRSSRFSSLHSGQEKQEPKNVSETEHPSKFPGNFNNSSGTKTEDTKDRRHKKLASQKQKGSDSSFNSPTSDPTAHLSHAEPDSYSTSSADDDTERPVRSSIKKSHSFMLDRAKNRLSIVAITNVFSAFMSADRKLQKKITELAHDKDSYFGNLVQDYKAYSLEMMAKQRSSTEMLQEIRLMMTQLKSYLVQSTELKSMVDYAFYTDDKIDAIVEAALCKCVLKPLKSPIECYLREIHNKDGCLRLLTENQLVIQDTTTTDLGVTTSVPDSGVMEKIMHKFVTMHKTYSPEKKITYLLKSCKLIYDSMATGNPGKPHGADDFLPVLMYVLARCDLVALLLDVEYMMELMDPALQLGEGSYYLTTTYGALEHIKNYDKITVTRQLSLEVQDSIHRWERRRTLNKARVSRSSIQDFITISFEELDSKTRTLATKSDTSVTQVLQQCAEQFEASEPENYGLFVLVNERCLRLTEDSFPQKVKSSLLKNEQKLDFHFLYKTTSEQDTVMKELDFL